MKAARREDYQEDMKVMLDTYSDDFNPSRLKTQLELLSTKFGSQEPGPSMKDIKTYFASLSPCNRVFMSELCTALNIIQVIPGTNAVSEQSASALRRFKTYLRSTMSQVRLNNLLMLHVHKDYTDKSDPSACLNKFVRGSEHRLNLLESFECRLFIYI